MGSGKDPNRQLLAYCVADEGSVGSVRLWHLDTGEWRTIFSQESGVSGRLAFSPDGTTLAVAVNEDRDGPCRVALFNVKTGTMERELEGHPSVIRSLAFSPDGQRLAGASQPLEQIP